MSDFELLLDEDNELRFNVAVEGSGAGSGIFLSTDQL